MNSTFLCCTNRPFIDILQLTEKITRLVSITIFSDSFYLVCVIKIPCQYSMNRKKKSKLLNTIS